MTTTLSIGRKNRMRQIDKDVKVTSKSDVFTIFPIGDVHIGARECAEGHFRRYVEHIRKTPNSFWIGGGDYCNQITPQDTKRFDMSALPDWLLDGKPANVRDALTDICLQERRRFLSIVRPIKSKCLGLISGNHEAALTKFCNNAHHALMCDELESPDLTDAAFLRLKFKITNGCGASVILAILHGHGGGRSAGSEANKLHALSEMFDADIIIRGHSHTFEIDTPQIFLTMPRSGVLKDELITRTVHKANWGSWTKSFPDGPATYATRACYPPRPLQSMEIKIKPFHNFNDTVLGKTVVCTETRIQIRPCDFGDQI